MSRIEELKQQIAQLDTLIRDGVLTGDAARDARAALEKELTAAVLEPAGTGKGKGKGKGKGMTTRPEPVAVQPVAARAPYPRGLVFGITTFVLVFSAAGYAWLGNREGLSADPSTPPAAAAAGGSNASHDLGVSQIEGMIAKLAERLKTAPEDAEGWAMLGRSYGVLGRYAEALPAYRKVVALRPNDAQGYADLADAVGTTNGRSLDGEPEQLIAKALSLDPNNPKALFLAGTIAFNRGDAAKAAKQWELALKGMDPASEMTQQLRAALDSARERAGLPPLAAAAAGAMGAGQAPNAAVASGGSNAAVGDAAQASPGAAAGASIQGRVTLSDKVKAKASPEDTVFVFARPVGGGRAPLAILRKQVKDLPLDFTLDDSLSMSPAMRLSGAREVQVGARVSKSGTAIPQSGDLQVISGTVAVGAKGIKLDINELVP
jgi:cytochrome c-type biogenesis protein CcmH